MQSNDKSRRSPTFIQRSWDKCYINNDDQGYDQYVKSLEFRKKQKDEIERLRNELDQIKSLLKIYVDGNDKT